MDKIEMDCIGVILKEVGPTFFKCMANGLDTVMVAFFSEWLFHV